MRFSRQSTYGLRAESPITGHFKTEAEGKGANGKSTRIRTAQGLLGDYAQQTPMDTLMVQKAGAASNDLARLPGSRFVAASEAEAGQQLAEAKIKQMTGGDIISARFLYQEHFEFRPSFKLWLSTNKLPLIKGTDDGIWRRVRVIPFDVSIPPEEQDRDLVEKLKAESSGILNFALEGCKRWRANGLQPPSRVLFATRQYRTDMDVLGQFFDDCCVVEERTQVSPSLSSAESLFGMLRLGVHKA